MRTPHFEGLYLLVLTLATLVWPELDRMPRAAWLLLCLAIVLGVSGRRPGARMSAPAFRPTRRDVAIAAFASLPVFFHLLATWREEFPVTGDHAFHFLMHRLALGFWIHHGEVLLLAFLVGALAVWRGWLHWALPLGALALVVGSVFVQAQAPMARYPALSYSLAAPLNLAFWRLGIDPPLSSARLFEALSLPLWLLLLRPLLVPGRRQAWLWPAVAFFFWQKDTVYYFATAYLEPWSLIFLLLAFERVVTEDRLDGRLQASLLVGVAALFKETAILFLPFVWLAARPWREGWRGVWTSLRVGVVAATPFLLYLDFRREMGIFRRFEFVGFAELFTAAKIDEWLFRVETQFGRLFLVLVVGLALGSLVAACRPRAHGLERLAPLVCGVVVLFFFGDRQSLPWIGYPRFQLFAFAALLPALLPLAEILGRWRHGLASFTVVVWLAQWPTLGPFLALDFQPDPARSWMEHYDATSYYPIDELLSRADEEGGLAGISRLRLVQPAPEGAFRSVPMAYPEWSSRMTFGIAGAAASHCACGAPEEAVWVGFQLPAHLQLRESPPPLPRDWTPEERNACRRHLEESCGRVWVSVCEGQVVGLLGRR